MNHKHPVSSPAQKMKKAAAVSVSGIWFLPGCGFYFLLNSIIKGFMNMNAERGEKRFF